MSAPNTNGNALDDPDAHYPRHQRLALRASLSSGAQPKLLDAWERKAFTLVASHVLITEFREVAARPFFRARLRASVAELLAAGLRDFSSYCRDLPSGPIAPDPKDSWLKPAKPNSS